MKSMFTPRRKRAWLLLPFVAVLALFAASCSHSDSDSSVASNNATTTTAAASGTATTAGSSTATTAAPAAAQSISIGLVYDIGGRGDQSFNDSAFEGVDRARRELGITFQEASPNSDGSDRADLINLQAEDKDIVIGVGFLFGASVLQAAGDFPNTNFAIVDGAASDESPSNLAHMVFAEEQGSYLVGVAAGLKTTTDKIGFIGGVNFSLIQKFEAGFVAGVTAANPDAEVSVQYISDPPDFGGFNDPAQARVIADRMYEQGIDIIYHAAGGSGAGLFEAAKEYSETGLNRKVWAIGVDSDQYNTVDASQRDYILTSMIKRVDIAVFSIINDLVDPNKSFTGGPQNIVYDLSVDGVGYSTSGGFVADIITQLEDYKQRIISGDIVVPLVP